MTQAQSTVVTVDSQPTLDVPADVAALALAQDNVRQMAQARAYSLFGSRETGALDNVDGVRRHMALLDGLLRASGRPTVAHVEALALCERAAAHLNDWQAALDADNAALAALARTDLQSDMVHLAARMPSSVAGDKAATGALRALKSATRNVSRTPVTYRPASVGDILAAVQAAQAERDRKAAEREQKTLAIAATVAADGASVEASK